MTGSASIRTGRPAERRALEELQRRSSMHDSPYREQLAAHPDAVAIPADHLEQGLVRVAEQDGEVAGFAVLLGEAGGACELDGIFVEPRAMRSGIGRLLIEDAARIARERGAEWIDVVANPEADAFYRRLGFRGGAEVPTRFGPAVRMRLALGG